MNLDRSIGHMVVVCLSLWLCHFFDYSESNADARNGYVLVGIWVLSSHEIY